MSVAEAAPREKLCPLEEVEGRVAMCPGAECPFWENGCSIERLGLDLASGRDARLAHWLLSVRAQVDRPRLLHQLLPPGFRD
jgi:hypothetical protein